MASTAFERVALVTGANRGIGFEIARRLAALGISTVVSARDPEKARAAAATLAGEGLPVVPCQLDVRDQASVDRAVEELASEQGRLDILVNNAGVVVDRGNTAAAADFEPVLATLETNLFGAWRVTRACLPLMQRHGYGRIVNLSSGVGSLATMRPGVPGYRLSKTALNALTRILAAELAGTNILVNAACPGDVRTEMGGPDAPRSVEEAAETPVWLATLPDDGPSGGFFRDRAPLPW